MEKVKTHAEKLESIIESEQFLNEIQDMDILLERLLSEVRRITNADAGSIYINEKNILSIKCAQNDTLQKMLEEGQKVPFSFFSFPVNEKSISGYTVLTDTLLNIPDVYDIDEEKPYRFNSQPDLITAVNQC